MNTNFRKYPTINEINEDGVDCIQNGAVVANYRSYLEAADFMDSVSEENTRKLREYNSELKHYREIMEANRKRLPGTSPLPIPEKPKKPRMQPLVTLQWHGTNPTPALN